MKTLKAFRLFAFVFMVLSFVFWQTHSTRAGVIDCDQFWPVGTYYGEEVECMGDYPGNACEAICDYCRGTHCSYVYQCNAGQSISVVCTAS